MFADAADAQFAAVEQKAVLRCKFCCAETNFAGILIQQSIIVVVPENTSPAGLSVRHSIADKNGTLLSGAVDSLFDETRIFCPFENKEIGL